MRQLDLVEQADQFGIDCLNDEGKSIVRSIGTDRVDTALNGQLVHVAGPTKSAAGVADADLGVKAPGLKLARHVEMYQWTESESGSGQDRKFTYSREWKSSAVESGRFRAPAGHENPSFPAYRSREFGAADAKIGAFPVGSAAVSKLGSMEEFPISNAGLQTAQRVTGRPTQISGGGYYIGTNPVQPRVGDIRVTYKIIKEGPASFVGRQEADGLQVYRAKNGQQFMLAGLGVQSSDELFATAQECSEAPLHKADWRSDITVWVNRVEVGTWTSPGDFGEEAGQLTPSWWEGRYSQYGLLKLWKVTGTGAYLDDVQVADVTLDQLAIAQAEFISVRIGIKEDAQRIGGLNIFGRQFGNYPQDIVRRLRFRELELEPKEAQSSQVHGIESK